MALSKITEDAFRCVLDYVGFKETYFCLLAIDENAPAHYAAKGKLRTFGQRKFEIGYQFPDFRQFLDCPVLESELKKFRCVSLNVWSVVHTSQQIWGNARDYESYFGNCPHLHYDFKINDYFLYTRWGSFFSVKCIPLGAEVRRVIQLPEIRFCQAKVFHVEEGFTLFSTSPCGKCKWKVPEHPDYCGQISSVTNCTEYKAAYVVYQAVLIKHTKALMYKVNVIIQEFDDRWTSPLYIELSSPEVDFSGRWFQPGKLVGEIIIEPLRNIIQFHGSKEFEFVRRSKPKLISRGENVWFRNF